MAAKRVLVVWLAALTVAASGWAQARAATRVVTLAPHITEMVFAAGAGDTVVGTVSSSDYPTQARLLPKVGDGAIGISVEKLAALAPDLVLAWQDSGAVATHKHAFKSLSLSLEFVAPQHLDDIPDLIEHLGKRLGTPLAAQHSAQQLRTRLNALRRQYAARPPVSVYIEVGHSPLYAAGNDSLLNEALQTCGASNVFGDSRLAALPIGPEHILYRNPDAIIVARRTAKDVQEARSRMAALGVHTPVYGIDPDTLFRPGPRLIDAAEALCHAFDDARSKKR